MLPISQAIAGRSARSACCALRRYVGLMLLAVVLGLSWFPEPCAAGGGPENVFLVVNRRSWASMSVANHYIALRKLPTNQVLYLDWTADVDSISLTEFRQQLLAPIVAAIESRRIGDHIDYIVYSSDLPWQINATKEMAGVGLPRHLSPIGSLNGLTYLSVQVMQGDPNFLQLNANRYFRAPPDDGVPPSQAFRSWYGWGPEGQLLEAGGQRYLLSTMLAVTSGRGNSLPQVVDYLTRSVAADGTCPEGTIYYMVNADVRSQTRLNGFAPAVEALKTLGIKAEMVEGTLPKDRPDIQGLMAGSSDFNMAGTGSKILPGAICEHLTSSGGMMFANSGQTPLTHFLAHGAVGSSGAVTEPFAIQAKFPVPAMHVHYARGCSLGEAFYQSVHGPYQLLIVGDPLCQPWARFPTIQLEANQSTEEPVRGTLELCPSATGGKAEVDRFHLFVDGLRIAECGRGGTLTLDTRRLPDGYHELRVVGIERSEIETRGRKILEIETANHGRQIEVAGPADTTVRWGEPLKISVRAPAARTIALLQNNRPVGQIDGEAGTIEIDPQDLGLGPVALKAVSVGAESTGSAVSKPLEFTVELGDPIPAAVSSSISGLAGGLELAREDGSRIPVTESVDARWLEKAGVKPGQVFSLTGFLNVPRTGLYQFQVYSPKSLQLQLGDRVLYDGDGKEPEYQYIPLHLVAGRHRVRLTGIAPDPVRVRFQFGSQGTGGINDRMFQHLPRK